MYVCNNIPIFVEVGLSEIINIWKTVVKNQMMPIRGRLYLDGAVQPSHGFGPSPGWGSMFILIILLIIFLAWISGALGVLIHEILD